MTIYKLALLFTPFLLSDIAIAQDSETVLITPKWVKEHPDRIEISGGTAISGRTDHYVKLLFPKAERRRIHTTFIAERNEFAKQPQDLSMYATEVETAEPTTSVILRFTHNKPYSLKPIFRVATIVNPDPNLPHLWEETVSYIVDFRDCDELGYALDGLKKR
jgi:hypothetical protein